VSRRGHAADRRTRAHVPLDDPDAPGCCSICHLPTGVKNDLHLAKPPPAVEAARALEHRQRLD
jgi:hypothetical protein